MESHRLATENILSSCVSRIRQAIYYLHVVTPKAQSPFASEYFRGGIAFPALDSGMRASKKTASFLLEAVLLKVGIAHSLLIFHREHTPLPQIRNLAVS
jgi:hypothetical protein